MKTLYKYEFAEIGGKNKVNEFLKKLEKNERAKIFAYIYKLIEILNLGLLPKETLSKNLQNGIFELKIPLKNKISRCLYFFEKDGLTIFTNGFIKETQKTPLSEINKAKNIKDFYEGIIK